MTTRRVPGWPASLPPQSSAEFRERVAPWLLDRCAPETRALETVRAQPLVLAALALAQQSAALDSVRAVYRSARITVLPDMEPKIAAAVVADLEALGARLAADLREVSLVARALGLEHKG